ncbi:MAG: hypothetical protein Kow0090_09190 [Myxococcota bacterium]
MKQVQSEAIVLKGVNYGESDLMVTLLTSELGKVGAIARSGRKSQRRFGGALQAASVIDALLVSKREGLYEIKEATFIGGGFSSENFAAFAQLSYFCELALAVCQEEERSGGIYEFLRNLFIHYQEKGHTLLEFMIFEFRMLELFGFLPHFKNCLNCFQPPDGKKKYYIAPDHGAFYCPNHRPSGGYEISADEALVLTFLVTRELPPAEFPQKINYHKLRRIINSYIALHIGVTLKSEKLLLI